MRLKPYDLRFLAALFASLRHCGRQPDNRSVTLEERGQVGLAPGVRLGVEVCGARHPPARPREFDQRIAQRVRHAEVEAAGRARVGQRLYRRLCAVNIW